MPASYVHQCVASAAADALSCFQSPPLRSALLAGSEGPDPFFFSLRSSRLPRLGSIIHTQKTDDFLLALCDAGKDNALTRAYCCGFFAHYAADTVFHPFIYAHALTQDGLYSSTLHSRLEQQLETLHYRREGHPSGLPMQMAGFSSLREGEKDDVARVLFAAVRQVFPGEAPGFAPLRRSLDDCVRLCSFLRSEKGLKYRAVGTVLKPLRLSCALQAHMMPPEPPDQDIMNDAHRPWASIWTPDQIRHDSFDDLFAQAVDRAAALIRTAQDYMTGKASFASLRALHGGFSYHSGLPWHSSCPPRQAPGVKKS